MVEFDAALDMTEIELQKTVICAYCVVQMKMVDVNMYRCPKCGRLYNKKG